MRSIVAALPFRPGHLSKCPFRRYGEHIRVRLDYPTTANPEVAAMARFSTAFTIPAFLALGFVAFAPNIAAAAAQCSAVSYQIGKSQLARYLSRQGYPTSQVRFLMDNVGREVGALQAARLNAQAKPCGIDSARAHVLGCTREMLPGHLKASKNLGAQKNFSLWGRSKFAVRELLFIGAFHGCLGAAKDAMFR